MIKIFDKIRKEKEQLALGKYIWENRESKIASLKADVARLEKNVSALQASIKKEISMNAQLLAQIRNTEHMLGKGEKK
jgi:hypothetical protein